MPIKELKRTRYLDQAGSTFHQTNDHLEDVNHYHVPVIRMHNANLHRWGVAGGLEVEKKGPSELKIKEGLAIDIYGRSIPLASVGQQSGQPGKAFIDDNTSPTPPDQSKLRDVPVTVTMTNFADGVYYVTIELVTTQVLNPYTGQPESVEGRLVPESINSRIVSTPLIKLKPTASFINDGTSIILATVNITGGQVTSLSSDNRQIARIAVGEVILKQGGQIGAGPEVGDKDGASIKPIATGGLEVKVPNPGDSILFAEKDGGNFAKMSIAAEQIVARRSDGKESVVIDTQLGNITAGTKGVEGDVLVRDGSESNRLVITLDGKEAAIVVGAEGNEGDIIVKNGEGQNSVSVDGNTGNISTKRITPTAGSTGGLDIDARYFRIHGWDLCLDGRSGGNKRALVDYGNTLIINYANDYSNGVQINNLRLNNLGLSDCIKSALWVDFIGRWDPGQGGWNLLYECATGLKYSEWAVVTMCEIGMYGNIPPNVGYNFWWDTNNQSGPDSNGNIVIRWFLSYKNSVTNMWYSMSRSVFWLAYRK